MRSGEENVGRNRKFGDNMWENWHKVTKDITKERCLQMHAYHSRGRGCLKGYRCLKVLGSDAAAGPRSPEPCDADSFARCLGRHRRSHHDLWLKSPRT